MGSMAQAMQDSMGMMGSSPSPDIKVITGLADVIVKRSNSNKQRQKVVSPPKGGQAVRSISPGKDSYSPKNR